MSNRFLVAAAIAAGALSLGGCATIVDGSTQPISVSSAPEEGAQCTLKNSQGTWYLTTPGSTAVHKTKNDMTITCQKAGFEVGKVVAVSHFGGATFGNILAGGIVGVGIDAASGANYYYESPIVVTLGKTDAATPSTTASSPAPATTAPATSAPTATAPTPPAVKPLS